MTKERWERFTLFHKQIAHKKERISQKTDERISNSASPLVYKQLKVSDCVMS